MFRSRRFTAITLADFIVRSAYQMGKTPLLPIYAATLGANDAFLGLIVSVSTLTGLVLKPSIGILSDRWGRRIWLLLGTFFFAAMPFAYRLIQTPEQLFAIRIVHGLATAIYGPVTLAYVAELSTQQLAERLGWFGMARSAGYVVGPALAGWLLLTLNPVAVFTVIGLLSSLAFVPILLLPKPATSTAPDRLPLKQQFSHALRSVSRSSSIWLAGGLEATMYVAVYALKAFLPIYAISIGMNVALVGSFFAIQEAIHMVLKPWCGRLGDRIGHLFAIALGMVILGATMQIIAYSNNAWAIMACAVLIGLAQAFIAPSTVALISTEADNQNLGAAMGMLGTLKNTGKVVGPILAGLLIQRFDFKLTIHFIGGAMFLSALMLWWHIRQKHSISPRLGTRLRTSSLSSQSDEAIPSSAH